MTDDSKRGGEHAADSAQPKAAAVMKKSLQPRTGVPLLDPDSVGASTQPKAPAQPTQQAKPPPSSDD